MTTTHDECPNCKADLIGEEIPEKDRHLFGNRTRFGRVIGLYSMKTDRTFAWQCPDCGHQWR